MLIPTQESTIKSRMDMEKMSTTIHTTSSIMSIRQSQIKMIENQIRSTGIKSQDILDNFISINRENFVPEKYQHIAYADTEIPLIHNEYMLSPRTEAMVLHASCIKNTDNVLEIGTGSGFMAALLAYKAYHVTTVEIKPELKKWAEQNLSACNITNVTVELGNGANGWKSNSTYDLIVISGSLWKLSESFYKILNPGGRIVAFIGQPPFTQTQLIKKYNDAHYESFSLFGTSVPLLREQIKFS